MATPYKPNTRFKPWKIKIGDLVLINGGLCSSECWGQFIPVVLVGIDSVQFGLGIARFLSPEHGKFGFYAHVEADNVMIRKTNRNDFKPIQNDQSE